MKIKNKWKYSVEERQFDGNIIFILKGSHEKNMFSLTSSSNPFHSLHSMLVMSISLTGKHERLPGVKIK